MRSLCRADYRTIRPYPLHHEEAHLSLLFLYAFIYCFM